MPITLPRAAVRAGTVAHFAAATPPTGWLACNGAAVPRSLYGALFLAIGTTYGVGDGSTTFNLPDLRGEFIRGHDGGRGIDNGRAFGSAQTDAMQGHWHDPDQSMGTSSAGGGATAWQNGSGAALHFSRVRQPITDGVNGAPRTAAENRPRNVAMLACIKF